MPDAHERSPAGRRRGSLTRTQVKVASSVASSSTRYAGSAGGKVAQRSGKDRPQAGFPLFAMRMRSVFTCAWPRRAGQQTTFCLILNTERRDMCSIMQEQRPQSNCAEMESIWQQKEESKMMQQREKQEDRIKREEEKMRAKVVFLKKD